MPPFVSLADGAQVELVFILDGLVVEDRLWFVSRQPPITNTQLLALADGVFTWHSSQVMPLLASGLSLGEVKATDWTASGGTTMVSAPSIVPGGNTSGTHSANVSYRVRFRPSSDGYPLVNSNFVPGIPLDAVNMNQIEPTFQSSLFDAYVNLIDLASGFGPFPAWVWVVTSQIHDNAPRTEQAAFRLDFVQTPSIYISPRRRRISRLRKLLSP